ncbi:bile salt sulfotransferase 2-like [Peromyscus leucopus]|uniref:bile salt sulfotransferase 2-like n=1 Tax=Peromyscus leucopus TaxID=10041 RepID=UPI001884F901|nr:bile salt sulfotransferase 2-like [Peromyscus leucopus]
MECPSLLDYAAGVTKGNPKWIQSVPIWDHSPWIETQEGYQLLNNKEGPRLITSHLPFHLFPKTFFRSKCKVIYVIRNPRDVLVSGYFFHRNTNLIDNPESLGTYIEWFLNGNGGPSSRPSNNLACWTGQVVPERGARGTAAHYWTAKRKRGLARLTRVEVPQQHHSCAAGSLEVSAVHQSMGKALSKEALFI